MRVSRTIKAITVAGLVLVGAAFAIPASATDEKPDTTATATDRPAADAALLAELEEVAKTQTPEEVDRLRFSGEPMVVLVDVETGEYTAAIPEDEVKSADALTADTAAAAKAIPTLSTKCLNNPARTYHYVAGKQQVRCFSGTGVLSGTWYQTFKHSAGGLATMTWHNNNNTGLFAAPGTTLVYNASITVTKVTRS